MANDIIKIKRALNETEQTATSLQEGEFLLQLDNNDLFVGGLNDKVKLFSRSELDGKVEIESGTANDLNVNGTLYNNNIPIKNFYDGLGELGLNDSSASITDVHNALKDGERIVFSGSTLSTSADYSIFINGAVENNLQGGEYTVIYEHVKINNRYSRMLQTIINSSDNASLTFTCSYDDTLKKVVYNLVRSYLRADDFYSATQHDYTPTYLGFPFRYVSEIEVYVIFGSVLRDTFYAPLDRLNSASKVFRDSVTMFDINYSSNAVTGFLQGSYTDAGRLTTKTYLHLNSANTLLEDYAHSITGFIFGGKYEKTI